MDSPQRKKTITPTPESDEMEVNRTEFREAFSRYLRNSNVSVEESAYRGGTLELSYTEYSENTTILGARVNLIALRYARMLNQTSGYAPLRLRYFTILDGESRAIQFEVETETARRFNDGNLTYEEYMEVVWDL